MGIIGSDEQPGLVDALASMPPAERAKIVTHVIPALEEEMLKPPAPRNRAALR